VHFVEWKQMHALSSTTLLEVLNHQTCCIQDSWALDTLTPKISCVFLPNFVVFDLVGKFNLSKNKNMRI
jgi:hypothetical protein